MRIKLTLMYRAALLALALLLAGCAGFVYAPETDKSDGIRYYESAPYLLIYSDGKGGLQWQIRYLPDQSHVMTVRPEVFAGRTEMTLYFKNGMLTGSSLMADSTDVPKAIIAAAQAAVPLLVSGIGEGPKRKGFPAPYLYKIVVDANGVNFIGGPPESKDKDGKTVPATIRVPIISASTPVTATTTAAVPTANPAPSSTPTPSSTANPR